MTLSVSPISAYLHNNIFTITITGLSSDGVIIWGDGKTQTVAANTIELEHTYSEYGEYPISLESCNQTLTDQVSVIPLRYPDVFIHTFDSEITAGCSSTIEFSSFSFDKVNTYAFYVESSNSNKSIVPETFWSHLVPQWRFMDEDGNAILTLEVTGTPVSSDGVVIGYEINESIRFLDQLPGNITIFITKESSQ